MPSDSDLERLLRDARETLPEPDAPPSRRARAVALAAIRRRRPRRLRVAALLGVALAVAIGLGVGAGALVAPSGEAAKAPVGLGFLPEPGWFAFQTGGENSQVFQTVAVASNVPLEPDDEAAGSADASALPYATLLKLPSDGIIIVASFTRDPLPSLRSFSFFPERKLPLRLSEATPYIQYGTQVRPDEPLGQYQLRATVNGHHVDLHIYFGTPIPSHALRAEAQRQLDRLVVGAKPPTADALTRRPSATAAASAPGIVDRTFACVPSLVGGVRQIDARAHRGSGRRGSSWDRPAVAAVSTTVSGSAATAIADELAWVTAGRPSAEATVVSTLVGFTFPVRSWGTVAVNAKLCRASTSRVALSRRGLNGGATGPFDDQWDCATGRRVLVRVRAALESRTTLKTFRGFLRTTVPVNEASLAVRTESGKPLAYAQVFASGKSLLFMAPSCFPD